MRQLRSESFDRFGRYSHIWRLRGLLDDRRLRILDVGDPYGIVGMLFPNDDTVSIDFLAEPRERSEHAVIVGSGVALPFPDGSFDLVASHDALEHVPDDLRPGFLSELARVSAGPVLVVAPFDDERTVKCEEIVNGYYTARFGSGIDQLEEHRAAGLPRLPAVAAWASEQGLPLHATGDGWLYSWLTFMLIKAHLVSEGLGELDQRLDIAINQHLRELDRRAPHYRRVIVLRPPDEWGSDAATADEDPTDDLRRLMSLGIGLVQALPRGVDALRTGSPLWNWAERISVEHGPAGDVADAVATVLRELDGRQSDDLPTTHEVVDDDDLPTVSIVVVNLNGADHLRTCLPSLASLDYPEDRLEIIVVDNASTDDSSSVLGAFPRVRVLAQQDNLGFAPAVNVGARAATGECLVFVNNDMRFESSFLRELVAAYSPTAGYTCVGGRILSWDGQRSDFGEGSLNFYGMGAQVGYGAVAEFIRPPDGTELLFACGGAMLINRRVYLDVGGFDDEAFAYFEDVDLGWRLRILGHRIRLATKAVSYHRMHGTSSRFPFHQRLFLYERNALRSMLKNYETKNLPSAVAASLLLGARRSVDAGALDLEAFRIGGDAAENAAVPRVALAQLMGSSDLVGSLDELLEKRAAIQSARKVSDREVAELFGYPFLPTDIVSSTIEGQVQLATLFQLDRLFDEERATGLLVITGEVVGRKMRGPAIRALEIARVLSGEASTVLALPTAPEVDVDVPTAVYQSTEDLLELAAAADVVIIQGYLLQRHPELRTIDALIIADLYDPWIFENLEIHRGAPWGDEAISGDVAVLNELLDVADAFICASERQRDYWLGMLGGRGRLGESTYRWDPTYRRLIDVVPFGLPARAPSRHRVLKGVHPAVAEDDLVVLWGGGAWDWFDPLVAIRAFETVIRYVPNAKLYFLGLQLRDENVAEMRTAAQAVALADQLGLTGTHVIFGDWAEYEDREAYLTEADIALSAARDLVETRLAFRSRLLDAFWAGLPVVATSGDVLSDLVQTSGAGLIVPPNDPMALADALIRLLGNPVHRIDAAARSSAIAERFRWTECVEPLRRILREPWVLQDARRQRPQPQRSATKVLFRQLRSEHDATKAYLHEQIRGLREHGDTAERLYRQQEERAELHLQEVKDLIVERAELQEAVSAARASAAELSARLADVQGELLHLRAHPAYRMYQKLREAERRVVQRPESS